MSIMTKFRSPRVLSLSTLSSPPILPKSEFMDLACLRELQGLLPFLQWTPMILVINGWKLTSNLKVIVFFNLISSKLVFTCSFLGNGDLGVTVEGPCEAEIQCVDESDGTCTVSYLPTKAGNYKINVLYDNKHVTGSPFNGTKSV